MGSNKEVAAFWRWFESHRLELAAKSLPRLRSLEASSSRRLGWRDGSFIPRNLRGYGITCLGRRVEEGGGELREEVEAWIVSDDSRYPLGRTLASINAIR